MSGNSINFDDRKINKRKFYMGIKILVSKKESYGKKNHLNITLDIMMMMMSLDHYV